MEAIRDYAKQLVLSTGEKVCFEPEIVGEGSTCVCYRGIENGWLYKEFLPLKFAKYLYHDVNTGALQYSDEMNASFQNYNEKYKQFTEMQKTSQSIYKGHYEADSSTFILWHPVVASDGRIWFCSPNVSGMTLNKKWEQEKIQGNSLKYLLSVFTDVKFLLQDVRVFHEAGIVNGDVKSDNFWCVRSNKDEPITAIRAVDINSAIYLEDVLKAEDKSEARKLFLQTTPLFYNQKQIDYIFAESIRLEQDLKNLDLKAIMKMLCLELFSVSDYSEVLKRAQYYILFIENFFNSQVLLMKNYYVAYLIAELFGIHQLAAPCANINVNKVLSHVETICNAIRYCLNGVVDNSTALYCQGLEEFNKELRSQYKSYTELIRKDKLIEPSMLINNLLYGE